MNGKRANDTSLEGRGFCNPLLHIMRRKSHISYHIPCILSAALVFISPLPAFAHLVNSNVGEFYSGMLHPITAPEHLFLLASLALLASQCGKKATRRTILLFPLALMLGILAGSQFSLINTFHYANLAAIIVLGILLVFSNRLSWWVSAGSAVISGLILGWRSGIEWAVSDVGWQFVPGAALTGFIILAVVTAWIPKAVEGFQNMIKTIAGVGITMAGATMAGLLLIGDGLATGGGIGLPTEEKLLELVSAPELSLPFVVGAIFVAMLWGAAHALAPGHGKAIVGAYLVGSRGTALHAIYLGLTVTVTHTFGVFLLGMVATLAATRMQPEMVYPFLGLLSGLMVFAIGTVMLVNHIRSSRTNLHLQAHPHEHESLHVHSEENHHHHDHHGHSHSHDHLLHHHHGSHSHSHLPPDTDDGKITWRSLLVLGVSGGLLPCPSAMVLLLTAIALHRIGFGLALVTAFSAGLAIVLTIVGLLFIKGSHLLKDVPSFSLTTRWLPVVSALVVCILGGGITLNAISELPLVF